MRRLPPLNSVRAFEAAVRLRSFTAAASELGVTQGAISRQIKIIERYLGVELFTPAGRGIMPTKRASEYAMELRAGLDRIGLATDQFAEAQASRMLRINSHQSFATSWLIPRLSDFQSRHPGIDMRIMTSSVPFEQLTDPFDIVFRRYPMRFPGYECRAIFDDFRLPVCSPEALARHPIARYEDLAHHTLLCHDNFAGTFTGMWDRWLSLAGVDEKMQPARLHFEKFYVALLAANEGLGLVLAPIRLVSSDLSKGRLVAPFREPAVPCNPVEMLFPAPPNDSSRTNAFVKWVSVQALADVVDIGQWRDGASVDHGPSHD